MDKPLPSATALISSPQNSTHASPFKESIGWKFQLAFDASFGWLAGGEAITVKPPAKSEATIMNRMGKEQTFVVLTWNLSESPKRITTTIEKYSYVDRQSRGILPESVSPRCPIF